MADAGQIKKTAAKVLGCVEKVSSFASSIDPLFGIVSSLVGVVRKGLVDEESHALDKDFQSIHDKLQSISEKNRLCLKQIHIAEVNETFGKHEEKIKYHYTAFNSMVALVKKEPDNVLCHMEEFQEIYERSGTDMSLNVYYRGVMGTETLFGKQLLKVYLENCDGDRKIMEHHCSRLRYLFYIGLIVLMAYTAIIVDDEDEVREKWAKRMEEIQKKMEEVLSQCKEENPV
ncbi:protein rapunzel-like [Diretmus argenteus]